MGKILFMRKGEIHTAPIVYIDSISIKNAPNKTSYTVGQSFDPTGMIVEALYKDGHIVEITEYAIVNGNNLSLGQTSVTINYTENGVTKTTTQAISVVKPLSSLAVGDIVTLNENGTPVEYLVVNQGKPSSLYASSCNGTWLLRKNVYGSGQWYSSQNNSYASSSIHSFLNNSFLNLFDEDIQASIKQVTLPYTNLSCKVFLLSYLEVGYLTGSITISDGAILSYFDYRNGPSGKRIAYNSSGNAVQWWLRTLDPNSTYGVWTCMTNGGADNTDPTYSFYIRPALVMPSNTGVNDDNSIG